MISLVIPYYNSKENIIKCLIGLENQTFYPDEILLIDDGSTDKSNILINDFLSNSRIGKFAKILSLKQNKGPGIARDYGVSKSKNNKIFFLDSDVVLEKNALKNFSKSIEHYDAVVGLYNDETFNRGILQSTKCLYYYSIFKSNKIKPYDIFDAALAGIRKDVYLNSGGYNKKFDKNIDFENEELGSRIIENYKQVLDPSIMGGHIWPKTSRLITTLIIRTSYYIEFLFVKKKSQKAVFKIEEGFKLLLNNMILLNLVLILINLKFFYLAITLFLINFIIFKKFYKIVKDKKLSFFKYFFSLIIIHFFILIGITYGFLKVISNRNKIKEIFKNN